MNRSMVVVFRDGGGAWRWFLRPGFRHCFAVVATKQGWTRVDALLHRLDVHPLEEWSEGLTAQQVAMVYRGSGMTALVVRRRVAPFRLAPVLPFTCVESVKRLIGLHNFIITPHGLYQFLLKNR